MSQAAVKDSKTEISTLRPVRSFFARYWSTDGNLLYGGVKQCNTDRFQRRSDAVNRLEQLREIHAPNQIEGCVVSSLSVPNVVEHCPGSRSQAVGGCCFTCGARVTPLDAEKSKAICD